MKIKICGLSRPQDIDFANELKPDFIGFVFAKSKRQVSLEKAIELRANLSPEIQTVGVFVNESLDFILSCVQNGAVDIIQLHGDENEEYIERLKAKTSVPIVKAVRVQTLADIESADQSVADYLLLDAFSKEAYGGTGERFTWEMIPKHLKHSYFLAGGICLENVEEAMHYADFAIDVSGGVETDGVKDRKKMSQLIATLNNKKA